jgi:hypothetical protein
LDLRGRKWQEAGEDCIMRGFITCALIRLMKSRRMKWVGHVARVEEIIYSDRILVGKAEGKRPLLRPRRRWEDILEWILGK